VEDNKDGIGTLTYANKDKYVGEFKKGNRHGEGTYKHHHDGITTKGRYVNDLRVEYTIVQVSEKPTQKREISTTTTSNHLNQQDNTKLSDDEEPDI
jgi:hypothetical protein